MQPRPSTAETTPLARGMHRLAAGLQDAFEASKAIHHNLSAGEAREHAVARALEPHFPSRFRLSSGIVVNSAGDESLQQDILVTDPSVGTPFVAEGNIGVHPVETVVASLQVKTTLDVASLKDAVTNVASVKRLVSDAPRGFSRLAGSTLELGEATMKPFAGIVAFQASADHAALRQAYLQANAVLPVHDRVNALFVLDQFVMLWSDSETSLSVIDSPTARGIVQTIGAGRDSILFFYVTLMRALNRYSPPSLDLAAYLNANMPVFHLHWDRLAE
jgi:hypothetical protein